MNTIPKEPGSISEAVTSAKRASFPGNRKLRRPRGKCRRATSRVVLYSFYSSLEFRSFYLPAGYDPLNIPSHHSVASFRAILRISRVSARKSLKPSIVKINCTGWNVHSVKLLSIYLLNRKYKKINTINY